MIPGQETNLTEIEVFTTDLSNRIQVQKLQKELEKRFPGLKIHFDLYETGPHYPCGHTILRVEGKEMFFSQIKSAIIRSGFKCDVLQDRVCHKQNPVPAQK